MTHPHLPPRPRPTDRFFQWVGVVALVAIVVIFIVGTLADRQQDHERHATQALARQAACADVEFSGDIASYFGGLRARLLARIGTTEELSTDRRALKQVNRMLAAALEFRSDLHGACATIKEAP